MQATNQEQEGIANMEVTIDQITGKTGNTDIGPVAGGSLHEKWQWRISSSRRSILSFRINSSSGTT